MQARHVTSLTPVTVDNDVLSKNINCYRYVTCLACIYSTVQKECKRISPKFAFCLHEFSRIFQAKLRDFAASPFEEISLCRVKIRLQPRKFTHLQTIFQSDFVNSRTKIQIAYRNCWSWKKFRSVVIIDEIRCKRRHYFETAPLSIRS